MSAFLLYNKEHTSIMDSRITTTIYSGSGGGITGDIEIDIGMLQISKWRLNSIAAALTAVAVKDVPSLWMVTSSSEAVVIPVQKYWFLSNNQLLLEKSKK